MASAGSIFVDLLLKDSNYVSGLNRARGATSRFSGQVGNDMSKTSRAFSSVLSPVNNLSSAITSLGATLAASFSVQKLVQYSDTWKQLEGRLGLVVSETESMTAIQTELFDIATRTRQPLEGVYNLYTKLKTSVPEAQRAQYDFLGVTESINSALAITGEGSAQAASAILQFAQASASDFKASSQEINSLLDSAPRLALALQKSFGDGTKSLKELSKEGILSRDVIFRSLSGMGAEGIKLREELAKIPPTVGQAFTELNNAFLVFIGQNEAASVSANSLGLAVRFVADNLGIIANSAIALAAILTARLIPGLAGTAVGFISATQQSIAYQAALARMAGVSGVAATATLALSGALTSALALVGGPFGAAFLAAGAAVYYLTTRLTEQEKVSRDFASASGDIESLYSKLTYASTAREKEIRKEILALFDLQVAEVAATKARLDALQARGALGKKFFDPAGLVEDGLTQRLEAQRKALADLEDSLISRSNTAGNVSTSAPPVLQPSEEAIKASKDINSLYERNLSIITGLSQKQIQYNKTFEELNTLLDANKISNGEFQAAVARLNEEFEGNTEKWGFNIEEFGKEASRNLQDAFRDFFMSTDKGFDGLRSSFANMLKEMVANAAASNLSKILFGGEKDKGSGGLLGSLFGGISGSTSSSPISSIKFGGFFADGGYLGPGQFGIAGEAGAELLYGGKTGVSVFNQDQLGGAGGNTYVIDARGTDSSVVARLEQSLLALAGPGVIENRVSSAQMRGAL